MHFVSGLLFAASVALAAPTYSNCSAPGGVADPSVDQKLPPAVKANPRGSDPAFIQKVLLAPTARDRANLLDQPGDVTFDFTSPPEGAVAQGNGGRVVSAHAGNFPALIGNGAAMSIAFLGPCGLNSPHVHPRATELNIPVKGQLVSSFITENGVKEKEDLLNTFTLTVFPQGAIHSEFNPNCEEAIFVAGFSNVDPGVEQVAQTFFGLRPDIIGGTLNGASALNGEDIESFKDILPANVVIGVETCLKRCGIQKKAKRDLREVFSVSN